MRHRVDASGTGSSALRVPIGVYWSGLQAYVLFLVTNGLVGALGLEEG